MSNMVITYPQQQRSKASSHSGGLISQSNCGFISCEGLYVECFNGACEQYIAPVPTFYGTIIVIIAVVCIFPLSLIVSKILCRLSRFKENV